MNVCAATLAFGVCSFIAALVLPFVSGRAAVDQERDRFVLWLASKGRLDLAEEARRELPRVRVRREDLQ